MGNFPKDHHAKDPGKVMDPKLTAFLVALARADVAHQLRRHAERVITERAWPGQDGGSDPDAKPRDFLHL